MALTRTTSTGETVTVTRDSGGNSVRIVHTDGRVTWDDYQYMQETCRATGIAITNAEFRQLDDERQAVAAAEQTIAAARPAARGVRARYAGRCGRTGRRYAAGTLIEQTRYGWAIVGTDIDLAYQMDRPDSAF